MLLQELEHEAWNAQYCFLHADALRDDSHACNITGMKKYAASLIRWRKWL